MTPEIGAKYGPEAVGEVTLAKRLIERLPGKSLLLGEDGEDRLVELSKARLEIALEMHA